MGFNKQGNCNQSFLIQYIMKLPIVQMSIEIYVFLNDDYTNTNAYIMNAESETEKR